MERFLEKQRRHAKSMEQFLEKYGRAAGILLFIIGVATANLLVCVTLALAFFYRLLLNIRAGRPVVSAIVEALLVK